MNGPWKKHNCRATIHSFHIFLSLALTIYCVGWENTQRENSSLLIYLLVQGSGKNFEEISGANGSWGLYSEVHQLCSPQSLETESQITADT